MNETLERPYRRIGSTLADVREQERVELMRITGKARRKLQKQELEHLGIPYRVRKDGSIMLLKTDGGKIETPEPELIL